jgi:hypothetical protein
MSLLSSSKAQTRLSVALTLFLAGLLAWQVIAVEEKARSVQEKMPEKAEKIVVPVTKPAPDEAQAVVIMPPPPAVVRHQETPKPQTTAPALDIQPLQPEAQTATAVKQPEAPAPLQPEKYTPTVPSPDLLADRPVLKPQPDPKPVPTKSKITPAPAKAKIAKRKIAPVMRQKTLSLPAKSAKPRQAVHYASIKTASKGRALLRVLEHGKGPTLQISWPGGRQARAQLSQQLRQCFGMQLALMDGRGQLYVAESRRGESWRPNRDYYSGFVRQTAGRLPETERQTARQIRRRHGSVGSEVHIFPRRVDALTLGALQNLVGRRYDTATSITASYDLSGSRLRIRDFRVDGELVAGIIDLSAVRHCRQT